MSQSDELKKLRNAAGLTQDEAADEVGIPVRTYQAYERGERTPLYDKMDRIRTRLRNLPGSLASSSGNKDVQKHVREYDVEGSTDEPTLTVDERIMQVSEVPASSEATAHRVNGTHMGAWMPDRAYCIALNCSKVSCGGRYVVRWSEGEEKSVIWMDRHSDDQVQIRSYSPRATEIVTEVGRDGDVVEYRRQNGNVLTVQVLGRVVVPTARGQQMTEEVSDHLQKVFDMNGGG